jgi:hypothetical protein
MSNSRVLLHLGTVNDLPYQQSLVGLSAGSQLAWKARLTTPDTVAELETQAERANVTGIVCSNQDFLERLLRQQPDFMPPNNKRGLTLDDYQGSWLETPRTKLPVVIINPLENIVTTSYGKQATARFVKKLSEPNRWFKQTAFTWKLATPENLPEYFARWQAAALISIDIETKIGCPDRTINCVGYCAYFPETHTTECLVIPFTDLYFISWVSKFNNLPASKVMQNGLYDSLYLLRWGCPVHAWLHDTQHMFHSWYSEFPKRLDFITAYCLRKIRYWKDDGKTGTLEAYYRYNAQDCWATTNAYLAMMAECPAYAFRNMVEEFPLVFPALTCEIEGVKVDLDRLAVVKAQKEQEVIMGNVELETALATPGFNVASPPQVKNLFKLLGVGHLPDTAVGSMLKAQASSNFNNRILGDLIAIRKARKLVSTYLVTEKFWNGRLHYKLNPSQTDTGRLNSTESSFWCGLQIQNIPAGDSIKQCFVSDAGWLLGENDKAQSEARCVGFLSSDESLMALLNSGREYHSWNASAFFGVPYEQIYDEATGKKLNKKLRDLAKRTNHGANYNMGAFMMLSTMGPKMVAEAKRLLKLRGSLTDVCEFLLGRYSATYPRVKGLWYSEIIKTIQMTKQLVSPLGWTRVFFSTPSKANKQALNAAVAHAPQNLSVGIVNREFYNLWRCQLYGGYYASNPHGKDWYLATPELYRVVDLVHAIRIKAQIHDSIFYQYRESRPDVPELVNQLMTTAVNVKGADGITRQMIIPTDISAGKNRWSDLKD